VSRRVLCSIVQEDGSIFADFSHRSSIAPDRAGETDIAGSRPTQQEVVAVARCIPVMTEVLDDLDAVAAEREKRRVLTLAN
jgi:hypothetical protein